MTNAEFETALSSAYPRLLADAKKHSVGEDAEEIVQETLLAATEDLGSFLRGSALYTWLHAILRNKLRDHIERRQRQRNERTMARADRARRHGRTEPTVLERSLDDEHELSSRVVE